MKRLLLFSILILSGCSGSNNAVDQFLDGSNIDSTASLQFSATEFKESVTDGGIINDTITISLKNDSFNGIVGDDFVSLGRVSVSNIPAGLTAVMTKNGSTSLTFSLTGAAVANTFVDSVEGITVTFNDSAFKDKSASEVEGSKKTGISITYNVLKITYSSSTFNESLINDGSISNIITVILQGDTFSGNSGDDLVSSSKVLVSNIPTGLTAVVTQTASNTATISLTGSASTHTDLDDIANLSISFQDSAFNINPASNIDFSSRSDLKVDFINPAKISYDIKTLNESSANNGTISEVLTLSLDNDLFSGANGDDFVAFGKVTVANTPVGFTPRLIKNSNTELEFSLVGTASSHLNSDDISNLTIIFNASAFIYSQNMALVENYNTNNIILNFDDPVAINYSAATINENISNIGALSNTITLTVSNDTFAGTIGENLAATGKATISNLPVGTVGLLTVTSATTVVFSIIGNATSHANANDISNLTIALGGTAFTKSSDPSQISNSTRNDILVNFIDPYTLSYSGAIFTESSANNGTISNALTLTLSGTTFNGSIGENLIGTGKVIASNIPSGLSATIIIATATTATATLTGTASSHINSNDISNIIFNFQDTAFASGEADGVSGAVKNNLAVDFNDPASLAYSSGTFVESDANIGAIGTTITITLTNDTFSGSNSDNFVSDSKVTITNVPTGLTAVATRTSSTTVDVTLAGNATAHANSNGISNLAITFNNSAFSNVTAANVINYTKSDFIVSYKDPYTLSYSTSTILEAGANDGSISDTIIVNLLGTTFTGADSDDLVGNGKVSIANLPAGLSVQAIKQSNSQVIISFSGSATNHANSNSITNFTVNFQNSAFTSNEKNGITGSSKNDFSITFDDPPTLNYLSTNFTESVTNIGSSSDSISLVLSNKTFNASNGDDLVAAGKATITNLPAGMSGVITVNSSTLATLTLSGQAAAHDDSDDISNITVVFLDTAFTGGNAAGVVNYSKNNLTLDFIDPYTLSYSTSTINEASSNDGSLAGTITLTLIGTTFTGSNGDNFIAAGKLSFTNLPAGLSASAIRNSSSSILISFSGTAASHANADDMSNLTLMFADSAFISGAAAGVEDSDKNDFYIDFRDQATLTFSTTTLSEAVSNTGSISSSITITLANDTFSGSNGDNFIANSKVSIANLPSGLSATLTRASDSTAVLSLVGNAASHANANDISNLTLTFTANAFSFNSIASNILNYSRNDLVIDFSDPYTLSYDSSMFSEDSANDGSIGNALTLTLVGTTFSGSNGDNYLALSKASASNIPLGLSAQLIQIDSTTLSFSLTGNATNHLNVQDISNLILSLNDSAFASGSAAGITGSSKNDINVNFNDQPSIAYSATTFNELNTNVGRIDNTITATLTNDTFSGNNGDDLVALSKLNVSNLPTGLVASAIRTSATTVSITLNSFATNHNSTNNISNLTFAFQASAFTNVAPSDVSNSTKSDFNINYLAPYTVTYSTAILAESIANDGSISTNINLDLSGSTYSGTNSEDFVSTAKINVTNIPTGLTAVATRISSTQLQLSLSGNATGHANSNDISNLTIQFTDNAFASGEADGVLNKDRSDIAIDFKDPDSISYASSNFNEAASNNGSISETITITLVGDTFTGSNSDDFFAQGKVSVSNVPAGLTPVVTRTSSTTAVFSFTGSATSHANINDINNVTLVFNNSAFTNNSTAANVTGHTRSDLSVDFDDPANLSYSSAVFSEAASNDGSISNTLIITLSGDTFTGSNSDNFISDSKIAVSNIPSGLAASVIRTSSTTLAISLTGNASSHTSVNEIANLTVQLLDTAFTNNTSASNVTNYLKNNLEIQFDAPASLSYASSSFSEALSNDGSISTTFTIDLLSDTFTGSVSDNFVTDSKLTVANLPSGLTAVATRASDSQLSISLSGNATSHANINDISNLTFTFENSAFVNNSSATNVTNYLKNNLVIDFADPATLSFSGSNFAENISNNGSITATIDVDLSGDTFSGSISDDFVSSSKVVFSNVPTGLTPVATKISNTKIRLSFTGNASTHMVADNISNLTITFQNTAFSNNSSASNITNYNRSDLSITYSDPATLSYSGNNYNEAVFNNGSISSSISVTLSGDTFTGSNGDDFVAQGKVFTSNVPAGLSVVGTRTSNTQVTFTLVGNASSHLDGDDIGDLTFTFQDSAFTNNTSASNVAGYLKNDISINYSDPAILTYSASSLNESSSNDGSVSGSLTITLSGDTFSGSVSDDFVAAGKISFSNVPTGLTATAVKATADTLTIALSGNGASHTSSDSISNLTAIFADSAFTNNTSAVNVTNYQKTNLSINFVDPPTLSYGSSTFAEATSNNGSFTSSITIDLISDTFSGSNGDDFVSDSKISVTNLPAGLTAVATRNSNTRIEITLTGNASSHANTDDISNLTFTFQNSAFTNTAIASTVVNYAKSDIVLDFNNPANLIYNASSLSEASSNDGAISGSFTIDLAGDTFSGTNGDNFVTDSKISVSNLPTGLTAAVIRNSSTQLTVSFSGNASSHADANDISNLTFTFQDNAFTNNTSASNVTNYAKSDLSLNFNDPAIMAYSNSSFTESFANNGSISSGATITITISGDTFAGINGDNFVADGKIVATNVPTGLVAVVTRTNATTLSVTLSGNASSHTSAANISNLTLTFQNSAFTNNSSASNVTNYIKNDLSIAFNDPANLTYASSNFNEAQNNNGSISNTIVVTLAGDTFTGSNSDDFIADSKISVANLPAGLSVTATRNSSTTIEIALSGNASSHANADDIANLTFTFQNSAFANNSLASNITNYSKSNFVVDFNDPANISFASATFSEASSNNGTIANTIDITLNGDTFSGTNGDNFISSSKIIASNIPTGLTLVATKISNTVVTLSITGNASAHANANDVSNLTVTFQDSAFTNNSNAVNVLNYQKTNFVIDYSDPATIAYSGNNFNESLSNDGSLTGTINIDLSGDTFTGSNSDNFISDSKASVANLPAGLTASLVRNSSTSLSLIISGNAVSHLDSDDISNLTVTLLDTAFTNNTSASNVTNYQKSDISVNFSDPATLSYSASSFAEASSNNGSISNTITLTLAGDTFTGNNSDNFVADSKISAINLPTGLSLSATKISDTTLSLTLSGNASSHANSNDISNLQITLEDSAFTNNASASNITNYNKSDFIVDFNDPASLAYADSTFEEAVSNNGSITETIDITLNGDTFSGNNGDNFVTASKVSISNVPLGLTAVATRISSSVIRISLSGNATGHSAVDSIANLIVTFQNSAFTNNSAASNVTNYTRSDLAISYTNPSVLSYSASSLTEALANDGGFTSTFNIDIIGDTFSGSNSDDFISDSKITVANLPSGLTLVATRVTNTRLTISLTGNATGHSNSDDVSNLSLTFENSAFTNNTSAANVTNYDRSDILIDYNDPASIAFSSSIISEAVANDGSITQTISIVLTGDTFSGSNGENFISASKVSVSNVPAGLSASVVKASSTAVTLSFSGNASSHIDSDDIANLTIIFANSAFVNNSTASNVVNYSKSNFVVDFNNPANLSYSASTFNEDSSNSGGFSGQSINIDVNGDTFTGANSDDFIAQGKISVSNLPTGLTAVATRNSSTRLVLTLTGNASSHADIDDVANLTFAFQNSAFTSTASASDVSNYSKSDIQVNFNDPASISYASSAFNESVGNNGSITNSVVLNLISDTFTGSVNDDFVALGKISVSNLPAGLTMVATKNSNTQMTLSITGNATSHLDANDISNLTITFNNSAFTNNVVASNVVNYAKSDLTINFEDPASLAYSGAVFNEGLSNDGSILGSITITLSGDTFTGSNGDNLVVLGKVSPSNIPTGLTAVVTKVSSTAVSVTLSGTASSHMNTDDISNMGLTFSSNAFTNNTDPSNVINYARNDLGLNFSDPATLAYSASTFTEAVSNNGAIGNSITITISGDTFTGSNSDNFITDSKISIANIPSGLTAVATRISSTQVTLTLTGSAALHSNAQDVANLEFTFNNSAFTNNSLASNIVNYSRTDIGVDYLDPATLTYASTVFAESSANNGSFTGASVVVTLSGDAFSGSNSDDFISAAKISVSNLPAGLTAIATRNSSTQITFTLSGSATSHANADDISNLGFTFANSAFTNNSSASNIINYNKSDLGINFQDPPQITYNSTAFTEAATNDGAIANAITLTLTGDTFSGSNSDDFVSDSKISVTNLPAGLTAVASRTSSTTISISITGNATSHANSDDISNLTFTFQNTAFTNVASASLVSNYAKSDLSIDYSNPSTLSYSGSTFNESSSNTGAFTGSSLVVTLVGDTFSGSITDDFISASKISVTNLPSGLTAVATKTSATTITFNLIGNATSHADSNDISNLTFTFAASAFTNNSTAANVTNYQKTDISLNFNDPANITYSGSSFVEHVNNDGSTTSSVTITISGDTFTGANGSNFVTDSKILVSNLPSGFSASIVRNSSTQLTFTLTGNASTHTNTSDVSNLSIAFAGTAFTGNTIASNVTNYQKTDFTIDFVDPYVLTYSTDTFNEHTDDNGTINNTIAISLAGTTFTGANSSDFVSASKVTVTNVPAGLTAAVTKGSDTQVILSLSGTASSANPADDISNLTVVFADSAFAINNAAFVANYSKNDLNIVYFAKPIATPTDLAITDVTNSTVSISWSDNATNESKYRVETCVGASCSTSFTTASFDDTLAANSVTHTFTGLTEGAFYRFRVRAENSASTSDWATGELTVVFGGVTSTDNGTGTTAEYKAIDCHGVTGTYAVLYWNSIAGANDYSVYDETSGSTLIATIDGSESSVTITDLDLNTAYSFRVVANMPNGVVSKNSATTDLTTSPDFVPCLALGGGSTVASTGLHDFYRPEDIFIYNGKLFLSDTDNSRVLIYNSIPTSASDTPDVVLGQDFTTNEGGTINGMTNWLQNDGTIGGNYSDASANSLDCPSGLWVGDVGGTDRLIVADRCNHRVLIWNGIPTTAHQSADLVVGQPGFTSKSANFPNREFGLNSPYDVWSDGTKLYIADYSNNRVNIYNSFPTTNGAGPDVCVGNVSCSDAVDAAAQNRMKNPISLLVSAGKLIVSDYSGNRVMIYNSIPASHSPNADVIIGQTSWTATGNGTGADKFNAPRGLSYDIVNDQLYVSDYNNHRIKVFSGIPSTDGESSTHVIGFSNTTNGNGAQTNRMRNPRGAVAFTGSKLFALDSDNNRIKVFNTIPSADAADPDFMIGYQLTEAVGIDNAGGPAGGLNFTPRGVAWDPANEQLFVTDYYNDRVLVWNGMPTSATDMPDYVLGQPDFTSVGGGRSQTKVNSPFGACVGGGKLWVADYSNRRFMVWNLPITSINQPADYVLGQTSWTAASDSGGKSRMREPRDCYYDEVNDRFFATDSYRDKVHMWDGLPSMSSVSDNPAADYIIGVEGSTTLDDQTLSDPHGITSDGTYIYVVSTNTGQRRIMAFPIPTADDPTASFVLGQPNFTTADNSVSQSITRRPMGVMYYNNRLYYSDWEAYRVAWWDAPGTSGTNYQPLAGMFGHRGNDWNSTQKLFDHWTDTQTEGMATDGKRMIITDFLNGRIIITPLLD